MFAATQQIASVAGLRATKVQVKFARGRFVFSSSLKMKISTPFFLPIAMRIITLNEKTRLRTYAYERERTMICATVNAKKLDPSHSFVRSFDRAKESARASLKNSRSKDETKSSAWSDFSSPKRERFCVFFK